MTTVKHSLAVLLLAATLGLPAGQQQALAASAPPRPNPGAAPGQYEVTVTITDGNPAGPLRVTVPVTAGARQPLNLPPAQMKVGSITYGGAVEVQALSADAKTVIASLWLTQGRVAAVRQTAAGEQPVWEKHADVLTGQAAVGGYADLHSVSNGLPSSVHVTVLVAP